jgi:hypothetical protein
MASRDRVWGAGSLGAPMYKSKCRFYYPEVFTDAYWKHVEKEWKISGTGIGKHLRELEKAALKYDAAIVAVVDGGAQRSSVKPAGSALWSAATKAQAAVDMLALKFKKDSMEEKFLRAMSHSLKDYKLRLNIVAKSPTAEDLDSDGRGLDRLVQQQFAVTVRMTH